MEQINTSSVAAGRRNLIFFSRQISRRCLLGDGVWPMSYVEQYYLANSGNILASFLASACANKLFARQIWILAFAFFDSANTIYK